MRILPRQPTPYVYLSGGHTAGTRKEEINWLRRTGCQFRCYSYAYVKPGAYFYNKRMHQSLDVSVEKGVGIMMDSSAHTLHSMAIGKSRAKGVESHKDIESLVEKLIADYAPWCKKNEKIWDFYVTLDYIRDCPTIFKITERLEKFGITPSPVFHGDQDINDWFMRYVDKGYKLICIGTIHRPTWKDKCYYYDTVFNLSEKHGIMLHGLAVTSLSLMFRYPWYSVDSTTYVKTAAYGKIICIDPVRNVLNQVHISDQMSSYEASYNNMSKEIRKALRDQVESHGFDFEIMRSNERERTAYNAYLFCKVIPKLKSTVLKTRTTWRDIL